MENARAAVNEVRDAWHTVLDQRRIRWTPALHAAECAALDALEDAIRDYQVFVPAYDPKNNGTAFYAFLGRAV